MSPGLRSAALRDSTDQQYHFQDDLTNVFLRVLARAVERPSLRLRFRVDMDFEQAGSAVAG